MEKNVYYMFNKPAGCITARSDSKHRTVMDYFYEELGKDKCDGLFPVGRLDKDTEGLLIVTNDGKFCYDIMQPEKKVAKKYMFWAFGKLDDKIIDNIRNGVNIGQREVLIKSGLVEIIKQDRYDNLSFEIEGEWHNRENKWPERNVIQGYMTITEGCRHQVKRILKSVGCYVIFLKRVSIGGLQLDKCLEKGKFRIICKEELEKIFSYIKN